MPMGLKIAYLQGMKAVSGLTQSRSLLCSSLSLLSSSWHACVVIARAVHIYSLVPTLFG